MSITFFLTFNSYIIFRVLKAVAHCNVTVTALVLSGLFFLFLLDQLLYYRFIELFFIVDYAKEVCNSRCNWPSIVSTYLHGRQA